VVDGLPRFGVRVMRNAIKSYVIQHRAYGRTRRYTFGKVGALTPDKARERAKQLGSPRPDRLWHDEKI
jgi:hypothetical protein